MTYHQPPDRLDKVKAAYQRYRDMMFAISNQLAFWPRFMQISIDRFQETRESRANLFSSLFHVYDFSPEKGYGHLKVQLENFQLNSGEMKDANQLFLEEIMNQTIVRMYNAAEILLLHVIDIIYFDADLNPWTRKKDAGKIIGNICRELETRSLKTDKTNNRHIIAYLAAKSERNQQFLQAKVRIDLKENWQIFYEWVSLIRNINAHQNQLLDKDVVNQLNSIASDLLRRFFILRAQEGCDWTIHPITDRFLDLLNMLVELVTNMTKFACGQDDLSFLNFHK